MQRKIDARFGVTAAGGRVELSRYFEAKPNKEKVKAVAIDCAQHYRTLIYKDFQKASVVADKYHILRAADFAIDRIRLDLRGSIAQKRTKLKLNNQVEFGRWLATSNCRVSSTNS